MQETASEELNIEAAPPANPPPVAGTRRPKLAARLLLLGLLLLGLGLLLFYRPSGGLGDDVVAVVNGEQVLQSDVDVQISLRRALQEEGLYPKQAVAPSDLLNEVVQQRLIVQEAAKHNFAAPAAATVSSYLSSSLQAANGNLDRLYATLARYGLSRTVLLDTVRVKLLVDDYLAKVVLLGVKDAAERQERLNSWRTQLYAANVIYPHPLRDDSGPAAKVGRLAPEIAGRDLDGQPFSLTALKGKPLLINFWATWCTYCKREMPLLNAAYQQHRAAGLQMLALNTGDTADAATIDRFRKDLKLDMPVLIDPGNIGQTYNVAAFPTTVFVDREGKIALIFYGEMKEATLAQGLALILK